MRIQEVRVTPIAVTDPPLLNASGDAPWGQRRLIPILYSRRVA